VRILPARRPHAHHHRIAPLDQAQEEVFRGQSKPGEVQVSFGTGEKEHRWVFEKAVGGYVLKN